MKESDESEVNPGVMPQQTEPTENQMPQDWLDRFINPGREKQVKHDKKHSFRWITVQKQKFNTETDI